MKGAAHRFTSRNVLRVAERRGRVTDATGDAVMEAVDALYLEFAIRHDAPLATLDSRLARAARAEGIRVEP